MTDFTDIVFPDNNENEFIKIAEKLDVSNLIFCYDYRVYKEKSRILKKEFNKKLNVNHSVFVNTSNLTKAKGLSIPLLINRNDRFIFDTKFKVPLTVFELESIAGFDSLHYRHSGLNHIFCRLANKNNLILGLSFSQLLNSFPLRGSMILGRILQNVKLARKYKMRVKLASFARNPYEMRAFNDMLSLGNLLGMHPSEAKKALREPIY